MMRTLFVDLPFSSIYRPNLALETLAACLREAGFECDIRYSKLDFASRIGIETYTQIAEKLLPRNCSLVISSLAGSYMTALTKRKR